MPKTFSIVNLGCAKNEVDGEGMEQALLGAGYLAASEPRRADIVIVNTCGFIQAATDESLSEIASFARKKRPRQVLVAAGCLAEKWGASLRTELPQVDAVLGTRRWSEIAAVVAQAEQGLEPTAVGGEGAEPTRSRRAKNASAYIKIADGCNAGCAFCVIPLIKGSYRSRPQADIFAEATQLEEQGVRELVLVAQDTTFYGRDRGEREGLTRLLEGLLAAAPRVPWVRVMYAYPTHVDEDFLRLMASEPRLVSYLDLPLQHAHPEVLRRMRRPAGDPRRLVERVRSLVPDVSLRSTFIVGFPGESEPEHTALLRFLEEAQLDRVGVFPYSREDGAPAAAMAEQVPDEVKAERVEQAMLLQQGVSLARNRAQVGRDLDVLVEGTAPVERAGRGKRRRETLTCGRSYRDAPEVDGLVLFAGKAKPGDMVRVRITEALPYDLFGERTDTESIV